MKASSKIIDFFAPSITIFRLLARSLTSVDFYIDVIKKFSGLGVKYLLNICALAMMLSFITLQSSMLIFKDALLMPESKYGRIIDGILDQIPELYYDGSKLASEGLHPVYIKNQNGDDIALIDLENKVPARKKRQVRLVFGSRSLKFNNTTIPDIAIKYTDIKEARPAQINPAIIKEITINTLSQINNFELLLSFVLISGVYFLQVLYDKVFMFLMLWLFTKFGMMSISFRGGMRALLFATAPATLLQYPLLVLPSFLAILCLIAVQIVPYVLLIVALVRMRKAGGLSGRRF